MTYILQNREEEVFNDLHFNLFHKFFFFFYVNCGYSSFVRLQKQAGLAVIASVYLLSSLQFSLSLPTSKAVSDCMQAVCVFNCCLNRSVRF